MESRAHLNGIRSLSRSTLKVLPYQGQMMPIWGEKEMKLIKVMVPPTLQQNQLGSTGGVPREKRAMERAISSESIP